MNLKPLVSNLKLKPAPKSKPKYQVQIKSKQGKDVICGDPRATRALVLLMDFHAVYGGAAAHWGGPAALAEIMSALHAFMFQDSQWFEKYNFVNDAGHTENGVYALRANLGYDEMEVKDLKDFRSIKSKLTGHGESHLNPEGVLLSNGPLGSAFPQSQGLAFGDKISGNERLTFCVISDGASMEGEAKEAFAAIPGLASKGKLNPYIAIVSDNNTKLSGRIDEEAFSMAPSFESLSTLGWKVIPIMEGHDLQKVYHGIENAVELAKKNPKQPVCLWVKTTKGYGIKETENSASGGHGFPLKKGDEKIHAYLDEVFQGSCPEEFKDWAKTFFAKQELKSSPTKAVTVKVEKIQVGITKSLIKKMKDGFPIYSLSSDLSGSTGMAGFQKEFKTRSQDLGVAESNMVSMASGMSKLGYIPVVDTFAQFGVTKGNLPLTMASLSQCPVIAVFSHTGFQDAADGASHQATTYLAAVSSIPHVEVVQLSCSKEAEALMDQAVEKIYEQRKAGHDGETVVFFLGREDFPEFYEENEKYYWGKPQLLRKGKDATLVVGGSLVPNAIEAYEILAKENIFINVINNPFVNKPDVKFIGETLQASKNFLFTAEDHQLVGGMGSLLSHSLLQNGYEFKLRSFGIDHSFGQSAYVAQDLYKKHGLDGASIAHNIKSTLLDS